MISADDERCEGRGTGIEWMVMKTMCGVHDVGTEDFIQLVSELFG